jgi:hypothetical protein
LELLISLEIVVSVRILEIGNKRMFLANFDVIVSKLILVMLVLSTLNLILVSIFRVFIKV